VRSVDGKSSLGLAEFPLEKVRLRGFDWANSGRVILSADVPDPKEQGVQPMVTRTFDPAVQFFRVRGTQSCKSITEGVVAMGARLR
jgi:hypothetical protein